MAVILDFAPSGESWGLKPRILTGDLTLTDEDAAVQVINPNGATRTITLPTPSPNTPFFTIQNNSNAINIQNLYIVDHAGFVAGTLGPGESEYFINDSGGPGGFWWNSHGIVTGGSILHYGATVSNVDQSLRPNGAGNEASGGSDRTSPLGAFVLPWMAKINGFGLSDSFNAEGRPRIFVNGDERGGLVAHGYRRIAFSRPGVGSPLRNDTPSNPIAISALEANTRSSVCQLHVKPSGPERYGAAVGFGGNLVTIGKAAQSNGPSTITEVDVTEVSRSAHPMPKSGSISAFSWNVTTSGGTIRLHNFDAATSVTVALGSTRGSANPTLSFSAGDRLVVEYDSGTAPGNSVFLVWTNIKGLIYSYGGHVETTPGVLGIGSDMARADSASILTGLTPGTIFMPGAVEAVGFQKSATGGELGIYKGLSLVNIVDGTVLTASSGAIDHSSFSTTTHVPVSPGELLSVGQDSGASWFNTMLNVLIGPSS